MEEPLRRGEEVTVQDETPPPLGHVIAVTPDGYEAEIRWLHRRGHDHDVSVEPTAALRRVHESEFF